MHLQTDCLFKKCLQLFSFHQTWPIQAGMRKPESSGAHSFNLCCIVENSAKALYNPSFRTAAVLPWKVPSIGLLRVDETLQPGPLIANKQHDLPD